MKERSGWIRQDAKRIYMSSREGRKERRRARRRRQRNERKH
jgi:hypothetical protein